MDLPWNFPVRCRKKGVDQKSWSLERSNSDWIPIPKPYSMTQAYNTIMSGGESFLSRWTLQRSQTWPIRRCDTLGSWIDSEDPLQSRAIPTPLVVAFSTKCQHHFLWIFVWWAWNLPSDQFLSLAWVWFSGDLWYNCFNDTSNSPSAGKATNVYQARIICSTWRWSWMIQLNQSTNPPGLQSLRGGELWSRLPHFRQGFCKVWGWRHCVSSSTPWRLDVNRTSSSLSIWWTYYHYYNMMIIILSWLF